MFSLPLFLCLPSVFPVVQLPWSPALGGEPDAWLRGQKQHLGWQAGEEGPWAGSGEELAASSPELGLCVPGQGHCGGQVLPWGTPPLASPRGARPPAHLRPRLPGAADQVGQTCEATL